jgi:hypothetical protein
VSQPEIDTWFADIAFLEVQGSTATKVKAALWAWIELRDKQMSLNQIRAWLVEEGFEVVDRG